LFHCIDFYLLFGTKAERFSKASACKLQTQHGRIIARFFKKVKYFLGKRAENRKKRGTEGVDFSTLCPKVHFFAFAFQK